MTIYVVMTCSPYADCILHKAFVNEKDAKSYYEENTFWREIQEVELHDEPYERPSHSRL